VRRAHAWFSEGLASYVEPIARVRAGLLDEKKMWAELVAGMPQGLPGPNDHGLDGNGEWGRVYWGGALYFLQADVEIRRRTRGAHSLESALRAVIATGENAETEWPITRVLEVADAATGAGVLREQYQKMGLAPGTVDLEELWKRLGVVPEAGTVRFDDAAPDAHIRKSMSTVSDPEGPVLGAHSPVDLAASAQKSKK
jgi:predicted metalloprotease with PDZ domain